MLYFDRHLVPISKELWQELFRDPSYGILRACRLGMVVVEASWVGVAHEIEDIPKIFELRLTGIDVNGDVQHLWEPRWFATEQCLLEHYFSTIRELLGKKK